MREVNDQNRNGPSKMPYNLKIFSCAGKAWLEWLRHPGLIDGFIIYSGETPNNLTEVKRVPCGFKRKYVERIKGDNDCFCSVASYLGEEISERTKPIRVSFGNNQNILPKVDAAIEQLFTAKSVQSCNQIVNHLQKKDEPKVGISRCVYCSADLELNQDLKIYECSSCHTQHVQRVADSKFVPVGILVNGICDCCSPRRPLIKPDWEQYLICSNSGEKYTSNGTALIRLSELDYGLCSCCNPPNALILNHQGQVVCSVNTDHLYLKQNGRYVYRLPDNPSSTLDEIDRALSDGSAIMMPNGVLLVDKN